MCATVDQPGANFAGCAATVSIEHSVLCEVVFIHCFD